MRELEGEWDDGIFLYCLEGPWGAAVPWSVEAAQRVGGCGRRGKGRESTEGRLGAGVCARLWAGHACPVARAISLLNGDENGGERHAGLMGFLGADRWLQG